MLKALQQSSMDSQLMPESPAVRAWREELEARGKAKALLAVLAARQFPVDDTIRMRTLNCTNLAVLERWIRQAATASSIAEVFEAFPPA